MACPKPAIQHGNRCKPQKCTDSCYKEGFVRFWRTTSGNPAVDYPTFPFLVRVELLVLACLKGGYGLKDAPLLWKKELDRVLAEQGDGDVVAFCPRARA